ncbi:MAG: 50S ribosomal protein L3 [Deltaproteobacteria bacterium]|nr:50S ribosomal protein L3 [Deltaproteobacteria bacterium]
MLHRMGLLGKKVGMMQDFDEKGDWFTYTVITVGPCVVLDIKTKERDGYTALKLGFDDQKPHRVNRPDMGVFAKADTTPKRYVREIRLSAEECVQFEVGQTLTPDQVFRPGDTIDVTGTSKGKGFQGVMKRYHFRGTRATHGSHEYFRHGGSIGCRLTPGRVYKGRKMPGQMGNKRVTMQNIAISKVLADKNLVLVNGGIPGSAEGYVMLHHAAKRLVPAFKLIQPKQATETAEPAAE